MLERLKAALSTRPAPPPPPNEQPSSAEPERQLNANYTVMPEFQVPRNLPLERTFCQLGFTVWTDVFSRDDIAALRRATIALFSDNKAPYTPHFSGTALFTEPFCSLLFRNKRFIEGLKRLHGDDFVFVNEFAIHDSNFAGWHTDTSSPDGKGGHDFHWSPTFSVSQVGVYLQDNQDNGAGLDMVPKSHVMDDPLAKSIRKEKGFNVAEFWGEDEPDPYAGAVTVRSKCGDVVMFHMRTRHRSSISPYPARNDDERKMAMFMIAGPNNAPTRAYREWLDEYARMNNGTRPPVPDDFRSFLAGLGLSII